MSADRNGVPLSAGKGTGDLPHGWAWRRLSDLARLESGHTPSRRHPEWWGGEVRWLALPDIRKLDGRVAYETAERTNDLGIANSSARILPAGTVALSRTASVGYVTILGREMATSQDFVNWVCGPDLDPYFLAYLFRRSREYIKSLASGAIHKTVYVPTVQSFWVSIPSVIVQRDLVRKLDESMALAVRARAAAEARLEAARELSTAVVGSRYAEEAEKGWKRVRLGELLGLRKEVVHPRDNPRGPDVFVGLEHIESGTGRRTGSLQLEKSELTGRKPRFRKGDIVYGYSQAVFEQGLGC